MSADPPQEVLDPKTNPDPNVKLPDSVARAAAFAADLHKHLYSGEKPQPSEQDRQQQEQQAQPEQPQPVQQELPLEQPPQQGEQPAKAKPGRKGNDDWNAMKERLRAEREEKVALAKRLQEAEAFIQQRQAEEQRRQQVAQAPRFITEQDENDYGGDFIDVARRAAKEALTPEVIELRNEVQHLKGAVHGIGSRFAQDAQAQMYHSLAQEVPNWNDINESDAFKNWLRLPDPYSGVIRQHLLMDAYNQNNAGRLTSFFRGFLSEVAATAPQNGGTQSAGRTNGSASANGVDLRNFAAPGRARAAAAGNAPAEKPVFTRAQISKFYEDSRRGYYNGRDAEKAAMERAIHEATVERRIIN